MEKRTPNKAEAVQASDTKYDSQEVSKDDYIIIETQDLSATSEHNPESQLTPGKRVPAEELQVINESPGLASTQQSSTKMKKIIYILCSCIIFWVVMMSFETLYFC
ncbi:hypothetical protein P8452_10452 [Trifolium repens]|nr:hypothetical protein P8452_10452 [Trifolium repens]